MGSPTAVVARRPWKEMPVRPYSVAPTSHGYCQQSLRQDRKETGVITALGRAGPPVGKPPTRPRSAPEATRSSGAGPVWP
eukprot:4368637-Alexandrium_andersonii.AAC.1